MTNYILLLFTLGIVIFTMYALNSKIIYKFENIKTYLLVLLVIFLVSCLIIYPNNTINAALNGLKTWSNIVLPSLMPFFIGSLLTSFSYILLLALKC